MVAIAIAGVIYALTIAPMVQNIQQQQNIAAWKKVYSVFSQAYTNMQNDYGAPLSSLCTNTGPAGDACRRDYFAKYISFVRKCDQGTGNGATYGPNGCFHPMDGSVKCNTGASINLWSGDAGAIMLDGTSVVFFMPNFLIVDVNGANGPNKVGKDIFGMDLDVTPGVISPTNNDIIPATPTPCGWDASRNYITGAS